MKNMLLILATILLLVAPAAAGNGIIRVKSPYSVGETVDRLEKVLRARGMTIFARIDHAAGAARVGQSLRPTELVIFGNPKIGSKLLLSRQEVGIDLPQKALIWQDENGRVWLAYNDPAYLVRRHDLHGCEGIVKKMSAALAGFAGAAVKKPSEN